MPLHISPEEVGTAAFALERQRHYLREKQAYAKRMVDEAAAKAKALLDADLEIREAKKAAFRRRMSEIRIAQVAEKRGISVAEIKASRDPARTIHAVISVVAASFGLTFDDLVGIRRTGHLIFPRHVAMYLCRKRLLEKSYSQIAHVFQRDHSTVVNAYEKIRGMVIDNKEVEARVSGIEGTLS